RLQLRVGNITEGRSSTKRGATPRQQANHNLGRESKRYSTHGPIQPRQDSQPGLGSLDVEARIRALASIWSGSEMGVRRVRERLFFHRQHVLSRKGNPETRTATRG